MSSHDRPVFASAVCVDITMPRTAFRNTRLPSMCGYIGEFCSRSFAS